MLNGNFPSPAHYEMLLRAQKGLNDVVPTIDAAEKCGVDCAEYRAGHNYLQERTAAFLREFWPNQVAPPTGTGLPHGSD